MKKYIFLIIIFLYNSVNAASIKTLTFNLGVINPYSNDAKVNINKFCGEVNKENYDIIFLQEVWIKKYRDLVIEKCNHKYKLDLDTKFGLQRRYEEGQLQNITSRLLVNILNSYFPHYAPDTGLMILSNHPLVSKEKMTYSKNGEESNLLDGEFAVNKGAIGAVMEHSKLGKIFVATTHLVSNYLNYSYKEQALEQLKELKTWLDTKRSIHPVILAGDFNIAPKMARDNNFLNTNKLWKKFRYNIFNKYNFTEFEDLSTTSFPGEKKGMNEGLVDHILSSKDFAFNSTDVVFKNKISDHFGIRTNITIR